MFVIDYDIYVEQSFNLSNLTLEQTLCGERDRELKQTAVRDGKSESKTGVRREKSERRERERE